jgi:DNA processing protein
MSQGCNQLIKNHKAQLLQSAEDLIQFLNWDVQQKIKKPLQKQLFIELNSEEEKIFNYLSENGQQLLDLIALETEIPVYQLASILLQLELKGVIKPLPGKVFELV